MRRAVGPLMQPRVQLPAWRPHDRTHSRCRRRARSCAPRARLRHGTRDARACVGPSQVDVRGTLIQTVLLPSGHVHRMQCGFVEGLGTWRSRRPRSRASSRRPSRWRLLGATAGWPSSTSPAWPARRLLRSVPVATTRGGRLVRAQPQVQVGRGSAWPCTAPTRGRCSAHWVSAATRARCGWRATSSTIGRSLFFRARVCVLRSVLFFSLLYVVGFGGPHLP